ncbi:hypothetical protein CDAR_274311 [Caerostris darwini]|uniref:Uncharacterized protein n=1 Tax=Caerostris darwini TaxID=1538125 RepID=A0AAV4RG23_9ARAC|nr:hypothetical protein CDAR_274311 [Caerostris darwini]
MTCNEYHENDTFKNKLIHPYFIQVIKFLNYMRPALNHLKELCGSKYINAVTRKLISSASHSSQATSKGLFLHPRRVVMATGGGDPFSKRSALRRRQAKNERPDPTESANKYADRPT